VRIQGVVIAEGFVADSRGALTAVGIFQNIVFASELPMQTKRGVLAVLQADPDEVQRELPVRFTVSLTSPSGKVLSAQTNQGRIGPTPWSDLPYAATLLSESIIMLTEYGRHTFEVSIEVDASDPLRATAAFFVRKENGGPGEA
jgi:hypothetical protein